MKCLMCGLIIEKKAKWHQTLCFFHFPPGKHASFRPALYKQIIFTAYRFIFPTKNIADLCSGDTDLQSKSGREEQEAERAVCLYYSLIRDEPHAICL